MAVHILDYVTDVLHSVSVTPISELLVEALAIQLSNRVHIGMTDIIIQREQIFIFVVWVGFGMSLIKIQIAGQGIIYLIQVGIVSLEGYSVYIYG
jgi:hypothetical protein